MIILNKSIKNSIFFKILIIFLLLCIYLYASAISYAQTVSNDISQSVFRLHVIANSDSLEDQNLKYKVRDNVINYMNSICLTATSKEEAITIAQNHVNDFYKIAKQTIIDYGYSYDVKVNINSFDFPTKQYGDICLPAGEYDALRIEIGNASGQNWWCVMFPPLCFVDVSSGIVPEESKESIKDSLSNEEEFVLITKTDDTDIKFKFKLLEMFQYVKIKIAKMF